MTRRFFARLLRDARGSTIIEFALLAPVMFGLMFGVIQVGLSMQAYNAMRNVSSETARYALVEYMKKNEAFMDPATVNDSIETKAEDIATSSPYMMLDNFEAEVTDAATQRVAGAHEKMLTVSYTPPNVLPFFNWASTELTFERPIFVIDE